MSDRTNNLLQIDSIVQKLDQTEFFATTIIATAHDACERFYTAKKTSEDDIESYERALAIYNHICELLAYFVISQVRPNLTPRDLRKFARALAAKMTEIDQQTWGHQFLLDGTRVNIQNPEIAWASRLDMIVPMIDAKDAVGTNFYTRVVAKALRDAEDKLSA